MILLYLLSNKFYNKTQGGHMEKETIDKIKECIDDIKAFINMDGGDIEFIKYEEEYVYVKLSGACAGCSFLDITLKNTVESYLQEEIPEIKGVINVEL